MDKKFTIIGALIIFFAFAFFYFSWTPNQQSPENNDIAEVEHRQPKNTPPPPPPLNNQNRATAPPPPPPRPDLAIKPATTEPQNYVNFKIGKKPGPYQKIEIGKSKTLSLEVIKGSQNYTINWFKKEGNKLIQTATGPTFNVSARKELSYYVVTVDDKIKTPRNVFFQVQSIEPGTVIPEETDQTQSLEQNTAEVQAPTATEPAPEQVNSPATEVNMAQNNTADVMDDNQAQKAPAEKPKVIQQKTTQSALVQSLITPLTQTKITTKAGVPLNISYKTSIEKPYEIFWFHKPPGKQKGTLIKKRKTLNFSLKRLNKYHKGAFYIQIKDQSGKLHKAPEYLIEIN